MTWSDWKEQVDRLSRSAGWAFRDRFTDAFHDECKEMYIKGWSPNAVFERVDFGG